MKYDAETAADMIAALNQNEPDYFARLLEAAEERILDGTDTGTVVVALAEELQMHLDADPVMCGTMANWMLSQIVLDGDVSLINQTAYRVQV